jgi:hypothetical protein
MGPSTSRFPLCMNAFQIWVIDTIVKNKIFSLEEITEADERTRLIAEPNHNTTESTATTVENL